MENCLVLIRMKFNLESVSLPSNLICIYIFKVFFVLIWMYSAQSFPKFRQVNIFLLKRFFKVFEKSFVLEQSTYLENQR